MKKILVVDDAPDVQFLVKATLGRDFAVTSVLTAAAALTALEVSQFDLILLDVTLPDEDGFQFCVHLKNDADSRDLPIIFLSGKTEVLDKVKGLALGASDYVTKPFSPAELRARVEARLRESHKIKKHDDLFEKFDMKFSIALQKVVILNQGQEFPLSLTPLEFKILLHLARHADHVFTREQLIEDIWGRDTYVVDRTIDVHMSKLRRKLQLSHTQIQAVHGTGYRLVERLEVNLAK